MIDEAPWAVTASVLGTAIVALLVLFALLWQVAKRKSVRVSIVGAVAGCAASMAFFVPPVQEALHALTGIVDAGRLIAHSCILVAGYAAQMIFVGMIADLDERRRRHARLLITWVLGVAILVTCVLSAPDTIFDARHAANPAVAVYLVVFLVWLGISILGISLSAHRRAHELAAQAQSGGKHARRYLRIGLHLLSALAPVGGLYILNKIGFMALTLSGSPYAGYESYLASPLSQLAVLIAVAGVTVPLFGPPIDAAARAIAAQRTHRRLEPLWLAVSGSPTIAMPGGILQAPLRLRQRMAEIHDGLWSLRQWMPNGALPSDPHEAANAINLALKARAEHAPQADPAGRHDQPQTAGEAGWLVQVASKLDSREARG